MKKTKKKLFYKISSLLLAALCALSCVACASDGDDSSADTPTQTMNTNHVFKATETDEYVVQNGKTSYKLVYPKKTSTEIAKALDEFSYFFEAATGAEIEKTSDEGLAHNADNKYISLGNTTLLQGSGLTVDGAKLGLDGVNIFTKDKTVFIVGGTDRGVLNGVYTFMEYNFNFDCYSDIVWTIDKVSSFKLKNYEITDIPDMPERVYMHDLFDVATFEDYDRSQYQARMRLNRSHYRYIPVYTEYDVKSPTISGDNAASSVLPRKQFIDTHPKWYSTRSSEKEPQLCYTARGDKAEYEAMVEESFNKLKFSIENCSRTGVFQYAKTIQISLNDNDKECRCDACTASVNKYGCASAAQILYINDVADKLKAWQDTLSEGDVGYVEDLTLQFNAYLHFTQAPAYKNANGEWEFAEEMKLRDNVAVLFAYISVNYQKSMTAEDNLSFMEQVEAWKALGGAGLFYYLYNGNYTREAYYYDSFNFYTTEGFRYLQGTNPTGALMLGNSTVPCTPTAWNYLKIYVESKMFWDCSRDVNELVDKWFNGVFKDVAPTMKKAFQDTRMHTLWYAETFNINGGGSTVLKEIESKDYFPLGALDGMIATYDKALKEAEKYKVSAPKTYEQICWHIETEATSPLISKARLYYSELSGTEKQALHDRLNRDVEWLEMYDFMFGESDRILLGDWLKTL